MYYYSQVKKIYFLVIFVQKNYTNSAIAGVICLNKIELWYVIYFP